MKRLILCAVAVLLTSGALATRPAFAAGALAGTIPRASSIVTT